MAQVDVYSGTAKVGSGPLTAVVRWEKTTRLDRVGEISVEYSASDPQAPYVVNGSRLYAYFDGILRGAGIAHSISNGASETVPTKIAKGPDLSQELADCVIGETPLWEDGWVRVVSVFDLKLNFAGGGEAIEGPNDQPFAYDGLTGTYSSENVGSVDWWRVYIGATEPYTKFRFICGPGNGVTFGFGGQYFTGISWDPFTVTSDGTAVGGNTFQQNGDIEFSIPTGTSMQQTTEQGRAAYFTRCNIGFGCDQARIYDCHTWGHTPTANALGILAAKFPTVANGYVGTWALDTVTGMTGTESQEVYDRLYAENAFEALVKLADDTGEHFYTTDARKVVWIGGTLENSGVRAVSPQNPAAVEDDATIALIEDVRVVADSHDAVTRVYPYGSGVGDGALTLAHTTRGSGVYGGVSYVLNKTENYIALASESGDRRDRRVDFKDIGPDTPDQRAREAASDQLFDAALVWLARHRTSTRTYELTLRNLAANMVKPGSFVRVIYQQWAANQSVIDIDDDLVVLEVTESFEENASCTSKLVVSTVASWPVKDEIFLAKLKKDFTALSSRPQAVGVGDIHAPTFSNGGRAYTVASGMLAPGGSSAASGGGGGGMSVHQLTGGYHSETGLTAGYYLRAASTTSFVWAAIVDGDLPATIVRTSRQVIAGAGLTGGGALSSDPTLAVGAGAGITVNADDVALTTPGTLAVNSTNSASGNHTHAITSSSNPSGTASILASDASGYLRLAGFGVGVAPAAGIIAASGDVRSGGGVAAGLSSADPAAGQFWAVMTNLTDVAFRATKNGDSYDAFTVAANGAMLWGSGAGAADVGLSRGAADRLDLAAGDDLQIADYVQDSDGWRIDDEGRGYFRYLYATEFHAKAFVADIEQALAGGQFICKSVAPLKAAFTAPNPTGTATLTVEEFQGFGQFDVFVSGDHIRIRSFSRPSGTSTLSISDCWGTVGAATHNADDTQSYVFTRCSGTVAAGNAPGGMAAGTVVPIGSLALDYGASGNGYIESVAQSGAMGVGTPYIRIATWTGEPGVTGNNVERVRIGNMRDAFGVGAYDYFGIGLGDYASGNYLRYETNGGLVMKSANGSLSIDSTGFALAAITAAARGASVTWTSGATDISWLGAWLSSGGTPDNVLTLRTNALAASDSITQARAEALTGYDASVNLSATSGAAQVLFIVHANDGGAKGASLGGGGLLLAGSGTVPAEGSVHLPSAGYIGLGASAGRIEFNDLATDEVHVHDALLQTDTLGMVMQEAYTETRTGAIVSGTEYEFFASTNIVTQAQVSRVYLLRVAINLDGVSPYRLTAATIWYLVYTNTAADNDWITLFTSTHVGGSYAIQVRNKAKATNTHPTLGVQVNVASASASATITVGLARLA